jgi:hypothetical protein
MESIATAACGTSNVPVSARHFFLQESTSAISLHDNDSVELLSFGFTDRGWRHALDRASVRRGSRQFVAKL